ncbi:MAG: hypothetical protein QW392_10110 [Candidatus Jordarchaeales archaeon]
MASPGDLREVDEIKSRITIDGWRIVYLGMRYAFTARDLFMRVAKELTSFLGSSVRSVILQFTSLSGLTEMERLLKVGKLSPDEALERYASFLTASGWGVTKVVELDLSKSEFVFRVHDSGFAAWLRDNLGNVEEVFPFYDCGLLGYRLVGVTTAVLEESGVKEPLSYEEVECLARGGRYCEFHIKKNEEAAPIRRLEGEIPRPMFSYDEVRAASCGVNLSKKNPRSVIGHFVNSLKVEEGSLRVGRETVFFVPSFLHSIAYWMLPLEKFGNFIYTVYRKAVNEYGRTLAKESEKYGCIGVTEFFLNSTSAMGWGGIEVEEFSDSRVSFKIYHSLLGEDVKAYASWKGLNLQPSCNLIGYVVEGILNYFARQKGEVFTAREDRCIAAGDPLCKFTIEKER